MTAFTLEPLGSNCLQLTFGDTIDPEINRRVHAAWQILQAARLPGVVNLVPAYATLTVLLDPLAVLCGRVSPEAVIAGLHARLVRLEEHRFTPRRIRLPVRYDGPDLDRVAAHTGFSVAEVVRRHAGTEYEVYFLGFSPGFAYLGGLPPELATPRLDNPRLSVPAGSVAIGGAQTAVYPQATPGGWNLIGYCPEILFDPSSAAPCRLLPGDRIVFDPEASC